MAKTVRGNQALSGVAVPVPRAARTVLSLNGNWQMSQGSGEEPPAQFEHRGPVPGLADMAEPLFKEVGTKSEKRRFFWYRRTFKAPDVLPEFALLKIHKAKYGTAVWLNGQKLGEHLPCFTPSYWDLRPHLRAGAENELLVRVGADRESLPAGMPTGWDFEKYLFIPGIYDSVELILCDPPYIANVQVVPDIEGQRVRLLVELCAGAKAVPSRVEAEIVEVTGDRAIARGVAESVPLAPQQAQVLDMTLPVPDCRLWWPESPFLYEARLRTEGDSLQVRFGMREFRFDPLAKCAVLNGQHRYLVGSNVTIYRFFEDALRGDKPWDRDWVRKLHRQFKTMHWDTLRYCIGFPPDFWYDIADEEGFLIQDEFPIWTLNQGPEKLEAAKIVPEYVAWMRERWNHPCVVIWDAQNESITRETGLALQTVRHLDYSNRPWDNGWGEPQGMYDCIESHPYLFSRGWAGGSKSEPPFRLSEMPEVDPSPRLRPEQQALDLPVIINEYDWLWLTRDGQPTCLTRHNYDAHVGASATVEQRRLFHARGVAALTEFWRCHRQAAAVLHFCGLGYSRPGDRPRPVGGATSDDWTDIATLEFEPHFFEHVRRAFSPVGLMLDFWEERVAPGAEREVKVYVINDRQQPWRGTVRLLLAGAGEVLGEATCQVAPLGREILSFSFRVPQQAGRYTLAAELTDGEPVRSLRDIEVDGLL
jgi:beta-galactosidase